jgi:hypothetical protein
MARGEDPVRREVWRRRLRAFDREDTTVAKFCQREGVSQATFYLWRRKLADNANTPSLRGRTAKAQLKTPSNVRAGQSAAPHVRDFGRPKSRRKVTVPAGFVPISLTSPSSLEIWLPDGTRMLVPCHDRNVIHAVIAALAHDRSEDQAC